MKKKLLLVVAMVIALASLLAVSVFADSVHASVDKAEKVTLSDGTVLNLFDAEGDALIWYIDANAESGYSSIKAQSNTEGGPFVDYQVNSWASWTHGTMANQVDKILITDANGNSVDLANVVVFNIMDDDVKVTTSKQNNAPVGSIVNCITSVFQSKTNLQYAYLRYDTLAIQGNTFFGASNLKYVNFKDLTGLKRINSYAFRDCKSLFAGQALDLSKTALIDICGDGVFANVPMSGIIFPSTLTSLGNSWCLQGTGITSVTIPSGVTVIPGSTFKQCKSLTTVVFEGAVTTIGNGAFYQCTSLSNITIPSTVTKINGASGNNDEGTFEGCTSLTSITIPASLKDIYGNTFTGSGLETLIFEDRMLPDGTYNPLTFYGWAPFESCKSLTRVVLPEGLTNLPNGMFNSCSKLESITFASTITSISGGSHFNGTALNEVIGLENTKIQCIADSMFRNCKLWTGDENGVVRLPNTVKYIEGYGLADVKMTTLILGASFEYITEGNTHSFAGTTELKYVYAPASTTKLSQGNANFQYVFVTSTDEDALATISATTGISNVITYAQYQKGEYTSGTKYIVSGYNLCDAFYDGHVETEEQISKWTGDKFLSNYKIVCPCGRNCGAETVVKDLAPLFVSKGYSTSGSAMMQSFAINKALWESEYSVLFPELKYGMVAAYKGANDSGFDTTSGKIVNADCTGINTKVAIVDMTERDYDVFEIKISGVGAEDYKAITFFLCAYVVLDGTVYYIDNGTTGESAKGASYNDVEAFVSPEYGYVGQEEE